jgi:uncharacterized protein (TIGR03437 family)
MNPTHFASALLITAMCTISPNPCMAQTDASTILQITLDAATTTTYHAVQPLALTSPRISYGRITGVNGQPATGTWSRKPVDAMTVIGLPVAGTPTYETWTFDLAEANGTPAGTLTAIARQGAQQYPIVSATGVYFGASGYISCECTVHQTSPGSDIRFPSPAAIVTLYPAILPSVAAGTNGPAVVRSADSAQVSASQPARSGEIVTIYALNLLPQSNSSGNSTPLPVRVTISGVDASVLWAGPYADSPNGYQLNVRIPAGLNSGSADLQLVSGFIPGPAVPLYVDASSAQ